MKIELLPLQRVFPSPMNPRKSLDWDAIGELADNIEKQGLLQPITVRPVKNAGEDREFDAPDRYEIVCGERRYRASVLLHDKWKDTPDNGFKTIAAIVREMSDDEAFEAMITENLQRKDIDPIEEADAINELFKRGKTAEEIGAKLGKPVRFVQDRSRLVRLIPELKEAVSNGTMSLVAAQIMSRHTPQSQTEYHERYKGSIGGFDKQSAQSYTRELFLKLSNSPWYRNDEKDFKGECGLECSQCQFNIANQGSLFYDMNDEKDARCTNREKYESKTISYLYNSITNSPHNLIRKGEGLKQGGRAILFRDDWCREPGTKRIKETLMKMLEEAGYEVYFKGNGNDCPFSYDVYMKNGEEESIRNRIDEGELYPVLKVFSYDDPSLTLEYWKRKDYDEPDKQQKDPVEELIDKYSEIEGRIKKKKADLIRDLALNADVEGLNVELIPAEQRALAFIIFYKVNRMLEDKYGPDKVYGEEMAKTAKDNMSDMYEWLRTFIKSELTTYTTSYSTLYQNAANDVLPIWLNDYHSRMKEIDDEFAPELQKSAEELERLGYDTDGNPLKKETAENGKPELIQKWQKMKEKHPDAIILIEVGDFYECYNEDAEKVSEILNITLTTGKGCKLCGFPHHALDTYLPQIIRSGNRAAICE